MGPAFPGTREVGELQTGSQERADSWAAAMPRHMTAGLGWRAAASVIIVFGWLVFFLLFVAFWADRFSLFQNVMIFFASVVGAIGILGAMWASYGMRWAR